MNPSAPLPTGSGPDDPVSRSVSTVRQHGPSARSVSTVPPASPPARYLDIELTHGSTVRRIYLDVKLSPAGQRYGGRGFHERETSARVRFAWPDGQQLLPGAATRGADPRIVPAAAAAIAAALRSGGVRYAERPRPDRPAPYRRSSGEYRVRSPLENRHLTGRAAVGSLDPPVTWSQRSNAFRA